MKKHILGVALFCLIVASFVLIYTFFYAPSIPPKEAVRPPVSRTETRPEKPFTCFPKSSKISHEVLSSQYFVDENKIVSKIRVTYNGAIRLAPSKIYVGTTFSSVGNIGKEGLGDTEMIENPFSESREKIVTVVSKVSGGKKIDIDENLYVLVSVTVYDGSTNYKKSREVTEAKAVLFVYGDKPGPVSKGRKVSVD
jgi:hypothetical protein